MKEFYTPLDEAKEEIWRRWNDKELQRKVIDFLGDVPEAFCNEPRAVLFRHIMTSNVEYLHFHDLAGKTNLKPLGCEYLEDKFCTRNADKVALGKLPFLDGNNGNRGSALHYRKIIDLMASENKRFAEIKTLWGESLVGFHHKLLMSVPSFEIYDASSWYKSRGKSAQESYKYFLSLFICNGILFETFVTDKHEAKFASEVVYPSFEKVESLFGLKPLIVSLIPEDRITDIYWWCYPDCVRKEVEKHV